MDEEALNCDPEATIDSEDCIYECELPEASFEVVGCDENEFTVEVSISDLGNGAPYTVSNSVNDETLVIDEEGTFDVAGFPIGDVVVITIESTFGDVCTVTSTELGCPFSIDEENQLSLNVFPNPANATLTIQSSGNAWSSVQVIDLAGRIVRDEQIMLTSTGVVIETSTLAEGDYLVRITSEGSTVTEKVMIQH
ncbi:MAG: T9SS type A sorting domain-containing protein [Flavobacteriales bacterium]|nr:T9SS type A sorting domain-containing protein [Flavobacteriales bacterium]MDG1781042.1 T9SS type A sorting domain-containing protein [Flavobacteriales bacterium]MDG2246200.1 T9SS type A sorting domain-containing protein [Flavobacteriales bacterium]